MNRDTVYNRPSPKCGVTALRASGPGRCVNKFFGGIMDTHGLRDLYIKETGNPFPDDVVKYADWLEEKLTSTDTGSQKCDQCEHFDLSHSVYSEECCSCKRYCADLFTLLADS